MTYMLEGYVMALFSLISISDVSLTIVRANMKIPRDIRGRLLQAGCNGCVQYVFEVKSFFGP